MNPLIELLNDRFSVHENDPLFGTKIVSEKPYVWSSYGEVAQKTRKLAYFLKSHQHLFQITENVPFPTVSICSSNREDWLIADFACTYCGYVSVGFHTSWPYNESLIISKDVNLNVAICDSDKLSLFLRLSLEVLELIL